MTFRLDKARVCEVAGGIYCRGIYNVKGVRTVDAATLSMRFDKSLRTVAKGLGRFAPETGLCDGIRDNYGFFRLTLPEHPLGWFWFRQDLEAAVAAAMCATLHACDARLRKRYRGACRAITDMMVSVVAEECGSEVGPEVVVEGEVGAV